MKPIETPVPRALAATGHRGVVYRDPYGVPFNGPHLLLLRPGDTVKVLAKMGLLETPQRTSGCRGRR